MDSPKKCENRETSQANGNVPEDLDNPDEDMSVHSFLKSAFVISGGPRYRRQTLDNSPTNTGGMGTPDSKKSSRSPKKSRKKYTRSKSTGALYRKPISSYDSDTSDAFDSSLESLIKHNLMAAKAMQPVPISRAKERYLSSNLPDDD